MKLIKEKFIFQQFLRKS